jgi:hypothetical protein
MCTAFILGPTTFTSQDGLVIPSRSIKKIAAVFAKDKRADRRHLDKQVGGICLSLNFKLISSLKSADNRPAHPFKNYSAGSYRQLL